MLQHGENVIYLSYLIVCYYKFVKRKNLPKLIFGLLLAFLVVAVGVFLISLRRGASTIACGTSDLSGNFAEGDLTAIFEDKEIAVPLVADNLESPKVLGEAAPSSRWIEVDLSEQKIKAWDGNSLFLESLVSTGLPWWPTPPGEYRVWLKVRATKMEGGTGKYYYYLPNVPFVMFFENPQVPRWRGFSLHGTYWHNDFGHQHSHGCVNLPTPVAEQLYYWTGPVMPEGKRAVYSSADNPGTRVVIHE